MNNEQIKSECELLMQQIENAKNRLKELRSICKHEETYEEDYMWRLGSTVPGTFCGICGELIRAEFQTNVGYAVVSGGSLLPEDVEAITNYVSKH